MGSANSTDKSNQHTSAVPTTFTKEKVSQLQNVPPKVVRRRQFKPKLRQEGFNLNVYQLLTLAANLSIIGAAIYWAQYIEDKEGFWFEARRLDKTIYEQSKEAITEKYRSYFPEETKKPLPVNSSEEKPKEE